MDTTYKYICRLSNIQRFQGRKLLAPYSVADHTLRVIFLSLRIADETSADAELCMQLALAHDFDEAFTGDIPAPVKKDLQLDEHKLKKIMSSAGVDLLKSPLIYHNLTYIEIYHDIVKLADMLECFITCSYEIERGNISLTNCYNNLLPKIEDSINNRLRLKKDSYIRALFEKAKKDA